MRAGTLDRFVDQLRNVQTGVDPQYQQPIFEDVAIRRLKASIIYDSADEEFAAGQLYENRTVTFKCRYFSGLLASDTLLCEGQLFDITGVKEIGRHRGLEIKAQVQS